MQNHFTAFFSHLGKRLLGGREALPVAVSATTDEEIPRYPPFMKGLPAAPVEKILSTQAELINAIEQALALPDDLYRRIALPVIGRYAAYSHLLPASENHHHRGAGGLFRHGLEAAHWATMASQGCLFATHATPKERKLLEPRWRLAVCFAGLLHDIGKPVSDMAVVDLHGQHAWNPCDENLTDWADQNRIDRYFLRWRENRHKRHEQFSALVIERVLTRESRSYILEPGPDIMQAMLETIHGLDRGAKCYELVMEADRKSVERDLKAHYHGLDSAMGMPVEKYLFDAMRRLIKSGQWTANDKGARIWRFKEGIHIVWRQAVKDIIGILAKDNVPGIPRDEDTLADILIERGLAIPKAMANGGQFRYWRMQPDGMNATLFMLRLSSIELIYSGEPPIVVDGIEVSDSIETPTIISVTDKPKSAKPTLKPKSALEKGKPEVVEIEVKQNDSIISHGDEHYDAYQTDDDRSMEEYEVLAGMYGLDLQSKLNETTQLENQQQSPQQAGSFIQTEEPVKQTQASNSSSVIEVKHLADVDSKPEETINHAEIAITWLKTQGLAGEWLIQLAEEIHAGRWQWGVDLLDVQDKCLLAFPDAAQILKVESNLFVKTLDEKGWLVTDILSPMRKVQEINRVRGILLAAEPSGMLKQLLSNAKPAIATGDQKLIDQPSSSQPSKSTPSGSKKKQKPKKSPELIEPQATILQQDQNASTATHQEMTAIGFQPENQQSDQYLKNSEDSLAGTKAHPNPAEVQAVSADFLEKPAQTEKSPLSKPGRNKKINQPEAHRQAIKAWVAQLETANAQIAGVESAEEWRDVNEQEIENLLQQTPGLTRLSLMSKLGLLPNFRSLGNKLQMRRKP
jgi:hypothetical protein